jgi:hypothetical protein
LVILGQNSLDWFKNTILVQKVKIVLIFVSKGQRVNIVLTTIVITVLESKHRKGETVKQKNKLMKKVEKENKVSLSQEKQHTHVSKPKKLVR